MSKTDNDLQNILEINVDPTLLKVLQQCCASQNMTTESFVMNAILDKLERLGFITGEDELIAQGFLKAKPSQCH